MTRVGLNEALNSLGYAVAPEALQAAATAIDRGHHLALIAAEGSGKECVYAAAAVARCSEGGDGLQALVLTATREAALRAARAIRILGADAGLQAIAPEPEDLSAWPTGRPAATCLSGRASTILPAVRGGRLSLDDLKLVVVDGVTVLQDLEEWPAVEAILDTAAPGSQKILSTDRWSPDLAGLLERQLPRARRWPEELFPTAGKQSQPAAGPGPAGSQLILGTGRSEGACLELLEKVVREAGMVTPEGRICVSCGTEAETRSVRLHLDAAGLGPAQGVNTETRILGSQLVEGEHCPTAILFSAPSSLALFEETLALAPHRFAIVRFEHVRHLELLAERAGWTVSPLADGVRAGPPDQVLRFRQRVQDQLETGNSAADLLVLEPLIAGFGATRVAAALSALLRHQADEPTRPLRPWPDVEADSGAPPPAAGNTSRESRGTRPAWTRIYVGAGKRDEVRPADLVGAITGEAGIAGGQIGKIEIRGSFALVDIDSQVVDEVVDRLNGAVIRGRAVTVRPDRDTVA